jgi:hypothetical protein
MDIYLTNDTFFDAKASYTTTIYANTLTVFVCEIASQTNKWGALIGPTNQQGVANTVCWFIEHPGRRAAAHFGHPLLVCLSARSPFGAPWRCCRLWSFAIRTLCRVVLAWSLSLDAGFGCAFVLAPFVVAYTHKALWVFSALAKVVSTTTAHTHTAFSSFPGSFYLVAPAFKG